MRQVQSILSLDPNHLLKAWDAALNLNPDPNPRRKKWDKGAFTEDWRVLKPIDKDTGDPDPNPDPNPKPNTKCLT